MRDKVLEQLDRERLIELARNLADIVSITGEEKEVAEYLGVEFEKLGMEVKYQEVEEGRPNVIGTLKGSGGGATLMFCAHAAGDGPNGDSAGAGGGLRQGGEERQRDPDPRGTLSLNRWLRNLQERVFGQGDGKGAP